MECVAWDGGLECGFDRGGGDRGWRGRGKSAAASEDKYGSYHSADVFKGCISRSRTSVVASRDSAFVVSRSGSVDICFPGRTSQAFRPIAAIIVIKSAGANAETREFSRVALFYDAKSNLATDTATISFPITFVRPASPITNHTIRRTDSAPGCATKVSTCLHRRRRPPFRSTITSSAFETPELDDSTPYLHHIPLTKS